MCDQDKDLSSLTAGFAAGDAAAAAGAGAGVVFSASGGFAIQLLTRPATPPLIPASSWEKRNLKYSITNQKACLSLSLSQSLTLLTGDGLSEEPPTLPFSHMLLMLRVPPVGISAIGDLGDLASLFPCGDRGWISLFF